MDILELADYYVFSLFKDNPNANLIYHDYLHTTEVVAAAKEIGKGHKLEREDMEALLLAAWFHDTGYLGGRDGHEKRSCEHFQTFLQTHEYSEAQAARIPGIIMATEMPQTPDSLLGEILADADLSGLGKKRYEERSMQLRTEMELQNGETYSDLEWVQGELDFLMSHSYHTRWAHIEYGNRKAQNIALRRQDLIKLNAREEEKNTKAERRKAELKIKEKKEVTPDRGIETMFRTSLRNHISLSAIADNKANIMLSINAIIISIVFSSLVPQFDDNPHLILPTGVLVLVCLLAMIFAILSTRPKVTSGKFTTKDIENKTSNLLFFGNFHDMELKDFQWGMDEMMHDKDFLYGTMVRDFYYLGKVLSRKYKYLRICYLIFMFGMIASVAAYLIGFMMQTA